MSSGSKPRSVTTNARAPGGQFVLHAKALPGNPYDGHTLRIMHLQPGPVILQKPSPLQSLSEIS